jgi:hypothetical protein
MCLAHCINGGTWGGGEATRCMLSTVWTVRSRWMQRRTCRCSTVQAFTARAKSVMCHCATARALISCAAFATAFQAPTARNSTCSARHLRTPTTNAHAQKARFARPLWRRILRWCRRRICQKEWAIKRERTWRASALKARVYCQRALHTRVDALVKVMGMPPCSMHTALTAVAHFASRHPRATGSLAQFIGDESQQTADWYPEIYSPGTQEATYSMGVPISFDNETGLSRPLSALSCSHRFSSAVRSRTAAW